MVCRVFHLLWFVGCDILGECTLCCPGDVYLWLVPVAQEGFFFVVRNCGQFLNLLSLDTLASHVECHGHTAGPVSAFISTPSCYPLPKVTPTSPKAGGICIHVSPPQHLTSQPRVAGQRNRSGLAESPALAAHRTTRPRTGSSSPRRCAVARPPAPIPCHKLPRVVFPSASHSQKWFSTFIQ